VEAVKATKEEAKRVAGDLQATAEAQPSTRKGTQYATSLYRAAAVIENEYGFGPFNEGEEEDG
jgi:hypothetical protein